MRSVTKACGVPAQLLVFDDEGHGLIKLKNNLVMYPIVVGFLDRQLRGKANQPEAVSLRLVVPQFISAALLLAL